MTKMLRLDQLRASEIRALPRERTVFFIPVGPIEDHGDALPVSLDLDEAEAVSKACGDLLVAEGWTVVLAPKAALGTDSNTSALAIRVRPHVLTIRQQHDRQPLTRHAEHIRPREARV